MIVCNCLAGGCVGLQAGSGGLQAGSGGLQSEGWGLALVLGYLGGSIGLALGYLVPVAPESLQNVENVLFLSVNLRHFFNFRTLEY